MAKCIICGKRGLFLKVNAASRCQECEEKELEEARKKNERMRLQEMQEAEERRNIIIRMRAIEHTLKEDECMIADHILNLVNGAHPEYKATVQMTTMYYKLAIPVPNMDPYAFARFRFWYSAESKWISIHLRALGPDFYQKFCVKGEKGNFGKIMLEKWDDVKKYDNYILRAAEYIWDTYQIENCRIEDEEYRRDHPDSFVDIGMHNGSFTIKINEDKFKSYVKEKMNK